MNRRHSLERAVASLGKYEAPTTDKFTIRAESSILTGSKIGVMATKVTVDPYEEVSVGDASFGDVDLFNDPATGE